MKHLKKVSVAKADLDEAMFFQMYFMVISFMFAAAFSEKA